MSEQAVKEIMYAVIRVEREGEEFYRRLAGAVSNQAAKDLFLKLAKDEMQHQKDFHDLSMAMKDEPFWLDSATQLAGVMSDMADKLIFVMKGSELIDMNGTNLKQALDIGIHNEKMAVRVYSELLRVRYAGFAIVLKKVIEEEEKHLALLESMKAQLLG